MPVQIIFATHNHHKLKEIQSILPSSIQLISLDDIGYSNEIEENGTTLEENAMVKCKHIVQVTNQNCFADDTGLEVDSLNGAPGVYSARFAGLQKSDEDNIEKLLIMMKNIENRNAQFRTCIQLYYNNQYIKFEGLVRGHILNEKRGNQGFGYDPVFVPENHQLTFAEMDLTEKNKYSHRAIAFQKMADWIKENIY